MHSQPLSHATWFLLLIQMSLKKGWKSASFMHQRFHPMFEKIFITRSILFTTSWQDQLLQNIELAMN